MPANAVARRHLHHAQGHDPLNSSLSIDFSGMVPSLGGHKRYALSTVPNAFVGDCGVV